MRTTDVDILLIPGWTGSGPDHWQSRWLAKLSTSRLVAQHDWDVVDRESWTARVFEAVDASIKPVILVAHSCGVPTVVHAAPWMDAQKIAGAFLVATPSEIACAQIPNMDPTFTPYPRKPLPFPSLLVASRNDEHCPFDEAEALAAAWGATLVDSGDAGHLNTASGHGPWPDGAMRFGLFLRQLSDANSQ
jgi:uncharacterized protein